MRRENRRPNLQGKKSVDKIILYAGIGVAVLAMIVFALFMYSKSLSNEKNSTMSLEQMANMANNNVGNTESASTEMGKSVKKIAENEIKNTTNNTNTSNQTNNTNTNNNANATKNTTNTTNNKAKVTTSAKPAKTEEPKKEMSFERPVEGEMVREYAKDNLIYSATLEEWTTHLGMDIKADKTTVVKAAEAGTVKSIKNDPRFGLTVVIEHEDNFQTVYSNLLTAEFVVEGEKIEKGQSIGTVGNTAVFEIADEPHLHFEICKDSLPVDPSIYIK